MIHLDVKKVDASHPGAAGGSTGAVPLRRRPPSGARQPGSATPTCTPLSTVSPAWPTPRPWMTRGPRPRSASSAGPGPSPQPLSPWPHATRESAPTPHTTTARSSATTASWPRSASTPAPTTQSSSAATPSPCGTTTTTTIDPTPPATTSHPPPAPQHASPTS